MITNKNYVREQTVIILLAKFNTIFASYLENSIYTWTFSIFTIFFFFLFLWRKPGRRKVARGFGDCSLSMGCKVSDGPTTYFSRRTGTTDQPCSLMTPPRYMCDFQTYNSAYKNGKPYFGQQNQQHSPPLLWRHVVTLQGFFFSSVHPRCKTNSITRNTIWKLHLVNYWLRGLFSKTVKIRCIW